jgi:hypothetical protein
VNVLLRQAGGFEGFGFLMVEVDLESDQKPGLVVRINVPEEEIVFEAASRSSDVIELPHQDLVSDDSKIQRIHHLGLEGVWLHPSAKLSCAFERLLVACQDQLDIRVNVLHDRVEVIPVVGVDSSLHLRDEFRVSFGHRPPSIPRGQQSKSTLTKSCPQRGIAQTPPWTTSASVSVTCGPVPGV